MRRRRSRLWTWTKRLVAALGLLAIALAAVAAALLFYFSRDLPSVEELRTWRPPQVTKATCRSGQVCAEFFLERRTWVDVATLPPHVRDAFLAAEDADFYRHEGLDYLGMIRSGIKNLRPGGLKSGASTISQQACRRLLLSQERTLSRKMREWILTPRMERALSKDEILNLYINTIYFGHQRYGVEEAALFYFGKHATELTLGEAAVLAGTVQLPHRINPLTNVVKAKRRQKYVLDQLARHGFVSQAVADAERDKPIQLGPRPAPPVGQSYAEEVRKRLVSRYGDRAVLEGGMRVAMAMDPKLQAAAELALRQGLEALDRRQGYRGPLGAIDEGRLTALEPLLRKRVEEAGKRRPDEVLIADLALLKDLRPPELEDGAEPQAEVDESVDEDPASTDDAKLARAVVVKPFAEGMDVVGVVKSVDDPGGAALVSLVSRTARVPFKSFSWARRRTPEGTLGPAPTRCSDVLKPGELVRIRLGKPLAGSDLVEASLAQIPEVQGALVAIDPKDRSVVAMVGGYDFATSAFNRATQALRQPGSAFKPFLYAAALATNRFTAISIINDAPEAIRDPWTGQLWKPKNIESGFEGPVSLRRALTKSKNTVSVRLIEAITPEPVIELARRAGISSENLQPNLTLALGTGEVRVIELANAYTTLQSLGRWAEPVVVAKVSDERGTILEEHRAAPEEVIDPALAYLATSLMRSVVEEGTATSVMQLDRPAAGKTGTTQEYRDGWFSGYTTDLVATVWVGFDQPARSLGPQETGGRSALPIWLEFMKAAHQDTPVSDFPVPPGVVQVRVDTRTGLLAGRAVPGRLETFLPGTEPTHEAPPPGTVDPSDFALQGGRGSR